MENKIIADYTQLLDSHISNDVKIFDIMISDSFSCIIYENGLVNYVDEDVTVSKSFDMVEGIVIGFVRSEDGILRIYRQYENYLEVVRMRDGDTITLTIPTIGYFVKKNGVVFDGYEFYCLLGNSTQVDYKSNQTYDRHGYNYIVEDYYVYKTDSSSNSYKSDSYRYFVRDEVYKNMRSTSIMISDGDIYVTRDSASGLNIFHKNGVIVPEWFPTGLAEKSILYNIVRDTYKSGIMARDSSKSFSSSNSLIYSDGNKDIRVVDNIIGLSFKSNGGFKVVLNIDNTYNRFCIVYDSVNLYDISNPVIISTIDQRTAKINFSNDGENVVIVNEDGSIYLIEQGGILTTINNKITGFMNGSKIHDATFGDDGFLYVSLKNKGHIAKNIYKGNYNIFKDLFDRYDIQDFQNDENTRTSNIVSDGNKLYFSCRGYHNISFTNLDSNKRGLYEYDSSTDTLKLLHVDLVVDRVYHYGRFILVNSHTSPEDTSFIVLEKGKSTFTCNSIRINFRNNSVSIARNIATHAEYYLRRQLHVEEMISNYNLKLIFETSSDSVMIIETPTHLYELTLLKSLDNVTKSNMEVIPNDVRTLKSIMCRSKIDKGYVGDYCRLGNNTYVALLLNEFTISIGISLGESKTPKSYTFNIPEYRDITNIKLNVYGDKIILVVNNNLDNFYTFDSNLKLLESPKLNINPILYNCTLSKSVSKSNVIVNEGCISGDNTISDFGSKTIFTNDKCHRSTLSFIVNREDDFFTYRTDKYVDRITNVEYNSSNSNFIGFGKEDCLIEYSRITGDPYIHQKYLTNNRDIVKIPFSLTLGSPAPGDDQYHLVDKWFVCENNNSIVGVIFDKLNGTRINSVNKIIYLNNKVQFAINVSNLKLEKDVLFFESGINHKNPSDNICYFYSESFGPLVGMIESTGLSYLNIFDGTVHPNSGIHNNLKVAYSKEFGINNLDRYMKSSAGCVDSDRGLILRDKIGADTNFEPEPNMNYIESSVNVFPVDGELGVFNYISNMTMSNSSSFNFDNDLGFALLEIPTSYISTCKYLVLNIESVDNGEDIGHFLNSIFIHKREYLDPGATMYSQLKLPISNVSVSGFDNDKFTKSKTILIDMNLVLGDSYSVDNITESRIISSYDINSGIPFNCKLAISYSFVEKQIRPGVDFVIDSPIVLNGYNRNHNSFNGSDITTSNYVTSRKYLPRIIDMDLTSSKLFFRFDFTMSSIHKNFETTLISFPGFKLTAELKINGTRVDIKDNNGNLLCVFNVTSDPDISSIEPITMLVMCDKVNSLCYIMLRTNSMADYMQYEYPLTFIPNYETDNVEVFGRFFGIVNTMAFSSNNDLTFQRFKTMGLINSDDGKILSFIRDFDKDNLKVLVGIDSGDIVSYELNRDFTKRISGTLNKNKYFGIGYGDIGYSENSKFKLLTIKQGESFVNEFERIKEEAVPRLATDLISLCGSDGFLLTVEENKPMVNSGKLVY